MLEGQHKDALGSCSHLFQMTDTLCLASHSLGRPDLISFRSLAWNSNLLIPALNHNSSLFPDTPQQNSNYQLPLLLSVCDGSWPIITWWQNKVPWRMRRLQLFVTWGHLWGTICQRRENSNKTAPKRWDWDTQGVGQTAKWLPQVMQPPPKKEKVCILPPSTKLLSDNGRENIQ